MKWVTRGIIIGHLAHNNHARTNQLLKKLIRKLLEIFSIYLGAMLSLFTYAGIKIISPLILIRVGEIESRAIGHLCSFEVYLCEKKILDKNQKKSVDVFFKNNHVCNKLIYKKLSKYLNIVPAIFIEQLFIYLQKNKSNSKHLVPYRHWRTNKFWYRADKYDVTSKLPSQFELSREEIRSGEDFLREVGIKPTEKYVCFFSRSSEYYGDDSPRNSSINGYVKAINWLVNQGYKIVRIGDSATEKLHFFHDSVIDYSCEYKNKTELKAVYSIVRCEYMVSTCSGFDHIAPMVRKKNMYVNYSDWGTLELQNSKQLPVFIPKKLIWQETGLPLNGSQIIKLGANNFWNKSQYEENGIRVIDNTEDEILSAVMEMTLRVNGKFTLNNSEIAIQNKFKEKFSCDYLKDIDSIPNICNKFLLENMHLLD